MMKLILSLTLIWTLSSTAEARKCWVGRDYRNNLESCQPGELCATLAVKYDQFPAYIERKCVPSYSHRVGTHIYSHNIGFGATVSNVYVCDTDGCNNLTMNYPAPILFVTNLQRCFTCDNPYSDVCNQTVWCVGVQDRCVALTVEDKKGKTVRAFGCASTNVCEVINYIDHLQAKFLDTPKCCRGSFCNSAWSVKLNVIPLLFGLVTLTIY